MTEKNTRIDFQRNVPDLLYRQAGGRCSVPRCKNPTMGPYYNQDGAVNMGVACHIYSASENGPRGWGGKDADFISSEKNCIWCCQYHASLIDKNDGKDYPASTLFSWKKLAEARTLKQMNDVPSPLGWIESIKFTVYANYAKPPGIILSKNTLMFGKNEVGKTALLEIAAAISNSKYVDRFSDTEIIDQNGEYYHPNFNAEVIYTTVDSFSKILIIRINNNKITRTTNETSCLLPPGDLEVIYCSENDVVRLEGEDDIDFLTRVLNVDKSAFLALAEIGTKGLMPGKIKFEQVVESDDDNETEFLKFKEDGKPFFSLKFKKDSNKFFLSFNSLSHSERARLILDLQITKAREVNKQKLTILLIETLASNFDQGNFRHLLKILEQEDFQNLVSIPQHQKDYIIDDNSSNMILKDIDSLKSWRLAVITSEK